MTLYAVNLERFVYMGGTTLSADVICQHVMKNVNGGWEGERGNVVLLNMFIRGNRGRTGLLGITEPELGSNLVSAEEKT
jgi:hypothetical protein